MCSEGGSCKDPKLPRESGIRGRPSYRHSERGAEDALCSLGELLCMGVDTAPPGGAVRGWSGLPEWSPAPAWLRAVELNESPLTTARSRSRRMEALQVRCFSSGETVWGKWLKRVSVVRTLFIPMALPAGSRAMRDTADLRSP